MFGGGFSVDASVGLRKKTGDVNSSTSIAVKYAQKAFEGMYAWEKTPAGNTVQFIGGKFNLGDLSLMAAYDDESLRAGGDNSSATLSARYTVGKMAYMVGYGRQLDYKANFFSAGVSYAYKPNTSFYASYGNQSKGFWGSTRSNDAYGVGVNFSF